MNFSVDFSVFFTDNHGLIHFLHENFEFAKVVFFCEMAKKIYQMLFSCC